MKVDDAWIYNLNIPTMVKNALRNHGVERVEDLMKLKALDLKQIQGLGKKGINEVLREIENIKNGTYSVESINVQKVYRISKKVKNTWYYRSHKDLEIKIEELIVGNDIATCDTCKRLMKIIGCDYLEKSMYLICRNCGMRRIVGEEEMKSNIISEYSYTQKY